ncbi:glycoside hydrolase family 26 protein [Sphingobium boeckii]|uniref:GH26 domain-containing protein n=1 Tax=Sphingobium boeckii TaxID=1082345 RepID=A0A7W9AHF8_9SPHN|nr:glycosyl hydrolase [Sphingobium boeckii]MBB5685763.1 hypothetical protein [Sphingobium boeckii]
MRYRNPLFACAAALICAGFAGCGQAPQAQAQVNEPPRPTADLFVYRGGGCTGRDKLPAFITMLGREPQGVVAFAQRDTWPGMLGSVRWSMNCWKGKDYRIAQSVPMLLDQGTTLAEGAAGAYDRHFEEFARILVAAGREDAYLRIGWEFNGSWYPWAAAKDPPAFKAYFKRIAGIFRNTPGAKFKIVWNPARGKQQIAPDLVYPGDEAVDVIALDLYNQSWRPEDKADPEVRWRNHVVQPYSLGWLRTFAAQHGKPVALPEWGTGSSSNGQGMGDDPIFITHMAEWIAANNVAFTGYWDYPATDYNAEISGGNAPKSAAAFRAAFGP